LKDKSKTIASSVVNQMQALSAKPKFFQTLQVKRTFDDFWGFHEALKNKFKNIRFPNFPESATFRRQKTIK